MANKTVYPYGTGGQMPSGIPVVNDLITGGADKALSAEQGKVLNEKVIAQTISVEGTHLIIGKITSDSYVTDGLIFHLDGINKGQTPGSWTDLVGGISFTNNNCNFLDNCVEFPSGVWGYLTSNAQFSQSFASGTIEIVYDGDISGGNRFLFYPRERGNLMVAYAKSLNAFVMGCGINTTIYTPRTTTGVSRLSMTTAYGIQNLESLSKAGVGFFSDIDTNIYIGRRSTSTASLAFVGKIYSIRIYNRQLSEIEMKKNQVYDQNRFSL